MVVVNSQEKGVSTVREDIQGLSSVVLKYLEVKREDKGRKGANSEAGRKMWFLGSQVKKISQEIKSNKLF